MQIACVLLTLCICSSSGAKKGSLKKRLARDPSSEGLDVSASPVTRRKGGGIRQRLGDPGDSDGEASTLATASTIDPLTIDLRHRWAKWELTSAA
eukprot:9352292-Pyramimonas_sp.AAC.1